MIDLIKGFFNKHQKIILQIGVYILIGIIIYFPAFHSYFQQDEWFFMAYFNQFRGIFWPVLAFFAPFIDLPTFSFHLTPLGSFLYGAEFRIFWIHYKFYILTSIIFHSYNCYLIYILITKISKSKFLGLFSSLFFLFSASIMEATFWVGAHAQVQLALTFYLSCVWFLIKFLELAKRKYYIWSLIFFILSILTKETVALLIFSIPFIVVIIKDKKYLLKIKSIYIAFIIYICLRLTYPILYKLFTKQELFSTINNHSSDPVFLFYFSISLILKACSQIFFGGVNFVNIAEKISDLAYPQYTTQKEVRGLEYLTFTQSAAHDIALYILAIPVLMLITAILVRLYYGNRRHFNIALYGCIVFLLGVFPLTILSGWLMNFFSYISSIESRQLYISAFGFSILFAFAIKWLKEIGDIIKFKNFKFGIYLVLIFFSAWVVWQKKVITNQLNSSNIYAKDRKEIINIWLSEKKTLDDKVIFYSESNVALYGFADYMLPFQNNPGQVILSVYGHNQALPREFLSNKSLVKGLTEQWYEEHNGLGIGYYLKKKDLIKTILDKKINLDNVISVRYDGIDHKVLNISQDIRAEMKTMFDQKNELVNWKEYKNKSYNFKFFYPSKYKLLQTQNADSLLTLKILDPTSDKLFVEISIYKKGESEGVSDKALLLTGTQNYFVKSLKVGYTNNYTAILIDQGDYENYFFSTITNKEVKSIVKLKDEFLDHAERVDFERFIKFIEFYN